MSANTGCKRELYRPAGAGPFPTIVAMHGCSGLMDSGGKIATAICRLGRKARGPGHGRAVSGQLRLARARLAMPRPQPLDPAVARARRRCAGGAHLAAGAGLGSEGSHQPARLVEWRHRHLMDGAAARRAEGQSAGFPLGGRAVSGLPPPRRQRLERAHSDADPDRRRRQLDAGARLRADGRRRARPLGARDDRQISRRASCVRSRKSAAAGAARRSPSRRTAPAARMSAAMRKRARTRSSACRNG